jgi:hypothetical protein
MICARELGPNEGRRVLVFSQFTSMLDLIKPERDSGRACSTGDPPQPLRSAEIPALCRLGLLTFCRRPLRRNGRRSEPGDPGEPAFHRSHYPARCRAGQSRPPRRRHDRGTAAARAAARHHRRHRDPIGPLRRVEEYSCIGKRVAPGRITRRMTATRRLAAIPRRRCG